MAEEEILKETWNIIKDNLSNRSFVTHPYLVSWVEANLDAFLEYMQERIKKKVSPENNQFCFSPKSDICIRRGSILSFPDAFFYTFVIKKLYKKIYKKIKWTQNTLDISYPLDEPKKKNAWTENALLGWERFPNKTLAILEEGYSHVIFLDIAACYDNINHRLLMEYLNKSITTKEEKDILKELQNCIGKWSGDSGKGLPQGYTASDILAKVYFEKIHEILKAKNIRHIRYVDDFRVFCNSEAEARRYMIEITEVLSNHGFSIQTHKTILLNKAETKKHIKSSTHAVKETISSLKGTAYTNTTDEELEVLMGNPDITFVKVLEKTFKKYFPTNKNKEFNKTLYHYLASRLGKQKSACCVDYVINTIKTRPEETKYSLIYLSNLYKGRKLPKKILRGLTAYLNSDKCFYDYQKYEILKFFYENNTKDIELSSISEKIAKDRNNPTWMRSYAFGIWASNTKSPAEIMSLYPRETDEIIKGDILQASFCLPQKEAMKFLNRNESASFWSKYIKPFITSEYNKLGNSSGKKKNKVVPTVAPCGSYE